MALKKGDKIRKGKFMSPAVFEGRKVTKVMFEEAIYKYMHKSHQELKELMTNPGDTPAFELMVVGILARAVIQGDVTRAEFLLNRIIGKVKDVVEIEDTTNKHETEALAQKLLEAIKK